MIKYVREIGLQLKENRECLNFYTHSSMLWHYTLSQWTNSESLAAFVHSGAHRQAMIDSHKIARQIITLQMQSNDLPDWKTAKIRLFTDKNHRIWTYEKRH